MKFDPLKLVQRLRCEITLATVGTTDDRPPPKTLALLTRQGRLYGFRS